jgi:hypothetical protein
MGRHHTVSKTGGSSVASWIWITHRKRLCNCRRSLVAPVGKAKEPSDLVSRRTGIQRLVSLKAEASRMMPSRTGSSPCIRSQIHSRTDATDYAGKKRYVACQPRSSLARRKVPPRSQWLSLAISYCLPWRLPGPYV